MGYFSNWTFAKLLRFSRIMPRNIQKNINCEMNRKERPAKICVSNHNYQNLNSGIWFTKQQIKRNLTSTPTKWITFYLCVRLHCFSIYLINQRTVKTNLKLPLKNSGNCIKIQRATLEFSVYKQAGIYADIYFT